VRDERTPILCLAPWLDLDEFGKGVVDWLEHIDQERWAPSLITTQPSANRAMSEAERLVEEVWDLPDLMAGGEFPEFILGFIESREVRLVHITDSRLAFDLLPDMASLPQPPAVVAQFGAEKPGEAGFVRYATRRYGNLIDAFSVPSKQLKERVAGYEIAPSRIEVLPSGLEELGPFHDRLYERLLAARPASARSRSEELFGGGETSDEESKPRHPLTFPRDPVPARTVGVIVPCFRHGIFLDTCIRSIKAQTLAPAQIVVVDDGSDDPETIEALARWEKDAAITIIRLPINGGPSVARNRGLAELRTSYVLSIDADDELLPDALERMLAQLEKAPENVGFIYPHAQHIGNRSDFVQLPAYNLWLLMQENYCPAPALFDRRLFDDTGVEYPEDIVVGHEDWDLILQLAEREVHGLHADGPTFLYRKQGFSRVNAVEYGPHSFHESIERRHPGLYRNADRIKADWAPAISILLLDDGGVWSGKDLPDLTRQTCRDFEVLANAALGDGVREVGGSGSPGEWLQAAVDTARGRWVCVLSPAAAQTLGRASFVEQLLYGFHADDQTVVIALGDAPEVARHAFSQLDDAERLSAQPVGIAFERVPGSHVPRIGLSDRSPVLDSLAVGLQANGRVQWRKAAPPREAPVAETAAAEQPGWSLQLDLEERRSGDRSRDAMRSIAFHQEPRLPELTPGTVRRWKELEGWIPSGSQPLCRHVDTNGIGRIVSNDHEPPPGYELEFDLGAVHMFAAPETRRLIYADHSFELRDDQNDLGEGRDGLGYVEEQPLPMLELLELRRMPETGRHVLVAGPEDPLFDVAEPVAELGWIEAFPILPRGDTFHHGPWGVTNLRRRADNQTWRHLYQADGSREERNSVLLGSLYPYSDEGLVGLQLRQDGRLATKEMSPGRASRDPRKIGRWIAGAPGSNGHTSSPSTLDRRVRHLARHFHARKLTNDAGTTLGWLRREDAPGCSALFSTTHPVTGDQLVTRFPERASDRGYLLDGVLGYILIAGADDESREASQMALWEGSRPVTGDPQAEAGR
jgi:glycosyltransferase involved in cell wall biosynthesis